MRSHLLALAAAFAFAGCATFPNNGATRLTTTDIVALEKLELLPQGRAIRIATRFSDGSEILAAPSVVAQGGQTAAIEIGVEEPYPTRYTLAQGNSGDESVMAITPATPTDFTQSSTGLSLECTPKINGAFIEISGRIVVRWKDGVTTTSSVGEGIGAVYTDDKRVVVTENRHDLPVFGSRTTPFFVRALPGRTYVLTVRGESGPITIDITASLLDPAPGEIVGTGAAQSGRLLAAR